MNGEFHQILSQLRKNKRVSQRKVAADLFISQALLSHYENGIREPGLDFVNRACSYYGVTADFLLGRTDALVAESLCGGKDQKDARFDACALVTLLQAIKQFDDEALYNSALRCFGAVSYRLLCHMANAAPDTALPLPSAASGSRATILAELDLCQNETQFLDRLDQFAAESSAHPKRLLPQQLEPLLSALDKQITQQVKE